MAWNICTLHEMSWFLPHAGWHALMENLSENLQILTNSACLLPKEFRNTAEGCEAAL